MALVFPISPQFGAKPRRKSRKDKQREDNTMAIQEVSKETFQQEVLQAAQPVLVDFWAPWCGYCTKLAPILEEVQSELADKLTVVKVNVDENRDVSESYSVMSLPTLLVFKDGAEVARMTGYMPRTALVSKLEGVL